MNLTPRDVLRFWSKVDKRGPGDCWLWKAGREARGYGIFHVGDRPYGAHRVSFVIANGPLLSSKIYVCHRCDNPPCVNPAHLYAGTHHDNMGDKARRNRAARMYGETNGQAVITDDMARRIFVAYKTRGLSQYKLARLFGVTRATVADIVNRRTHAHATKDL